MWKIQQIMRKEIKTTQNGTIWSQPFLIFYCNCFLFKNFPYTYIFCFLKYTIYSVTCFSFEMKHYLFDKYRVSSIMFLNSYKIFIMVHVLLTCVQQRMEKCGFFLPFVCTALIQFSDIWIIPVEFLKILKFEEVIKIRKYCHCHCK